MTSDDGDNWNQPGQSCPPSGDGDGLDPDVAAAIAQINDGITALLEIGDRGGLATRGPAGLIATARVRNNALTNERRRRAHRPRRRTHCPARVRR